MAVYDVSKWQPDNRIDELFKLNKNEKVSFPYKSGNSTHYDELIYSCDGIIIKLSESTDLDKRFLTHLEKAKKYNLPIGIYLMSTATNKETLLKEADFINEALWKYLDSKIPSLGIWLDLERPQVRRDYIYEDTLEAIQTMRKWWNNTELVGVYASKSYFSTYMDIQDMVKNKIPVWIAAYNVEVNPMIDYPYTILWQYTTHNDTQDENVFYGWKGLK